MATTETKPEIKVVAVPMTPDELASLDRLRDEDIRSRPAQVRWLIAQEAARRAGVREAEGASVLPAAA